MEKSNINNSETQYFETNDRYIQFDLGEENYAIHLLAVKEVIPFPETTPLPNSPSHYVGIMNLRGQIISVIDLRKKLNIKPKELDLEEAVIIVEIEGINIGIVVDSINKVLNLNVKDISEVPEVSSQVNAKYIEGVYKDSNNLTILLDLHSVFNVNEIKKLESNI